MSAQQLAPVAGVDIEAEWTAEQRAAAGVSLDPHADPFGTQFPLGVNASARAAHAASRTAAGHAHAGATNLKVVHSTAGPAASGLRIEAISKRYGARPVLSDFSLSIPRGGFAAIVGRSGCGKSTLLRLIAGLETPDAGHIALDGHTLAGETDGGGRRA
ncbi:ATP-binding cassette domain-containing protein [Pandoraea nosoerga]|nr:ATP-binding cassette domain-containing protein [Pandoraea nosoerga]